MDVVVVVVFVVVVFVVVVVVVAVIVVVLVFLACSFYIIRSIYASLLSKYTPALRQPIK